MTASAYDIIGVVFGIISILGIVKYLHRWLKDRHPPSCLSRLNTALAEVEPLLARIELARNSRLDNSACAVSECRGELHRCVADSSIPAIPRVMSCGLFQYQTAEPLVVLRRRPVVHSSGIHCALAGRHPVLAIRRHPGPTTGRTATEE
ncbi:hypothetical protein OH77DRAFT_1157501 [Trametes cingulata]|nr:hypothetical protein OH77DRAFT_1157501 [Trametes cingulata]